MLIILYPASVVCNHSHHCVVIAFSIQSHYDKGKRPLSAAAESWFIKQYNIITKIWVYKLLELPVMRLRKLGQGGQLAIFWLIWFWSKVSQESLMTHLTRWCDSFFSESKLVLLNYTICESVDPNCFLSVLHNSIYWLAYSKGRKLDSQMLKKKDFSFD